MLVKLYVGKNLNVCWWKCFCMFIKNNIQFHTYSPPYHFTNLPCTCFSPTYIFVTNSYNRSLKKFMTTRKVKFNYQVMMDIFTVGVIGLFSIGGQRYQVKEFDYLLYLAEFVWVFRSIRLIFRTAWWMIYKQWIKYCLLNILPQALKVSPRLTK